MECVYRSDDLAQAHLLAGRLSSERISATVFEAEFGSLRPGPDYFQVMMERDLLTGALQMVEQWKSGAYALASHAGDDTDCGPS
jgi:hypothetical protein